MFSTKYNCYSGRFLIYLLNNIYWGFVLDQITQIQMQDDISMFILLPDEVTSNLNLLEESLTAEFVQDLSMTLLPATVSLTLPTLRLSYATDLLPLLSNLGESPTRTRSRSDSQ